MGTSATQSVDGGTVTPAPFPPETRQPDRVPVVLFTTFLRWRRYWQFGVFEIHKDDKSNDSSCVRSLETLSPSSPPSSLDVSRVPIVFHPRVYLSVRTLHPRT